MQIKKDMATLYSMQQEEKEILQDRFKRLTDAAVEVSS